MDQRNSDLPEPNTLSILIAMILLAFTLTHFVSIPSTVIEFSILGIIFPLRINISTLVSLLVIGMTASGTAWILQQHPDSSSQRSTVVHWLLPSLSSMVLMLTIEQLPFGGSWWIAAFSSGVILALILTAEYCVLDTANPYFSAAEIFISGLSIALFFILAVGLHAEELRLFSRVPVLSTAAGLVFLRVIHLRTQGMWAWTHAAAVVVIIGELAAVLHYLPAGSIPFGIALVGVLYALIELSAGMLQAEHPTHPDLLVSPGFILLGSWILAIFL